MKRRVAPAGLVRDSHGSSGFGEFVHCRTSQAWYNTPRFPLTPHCRRMGSVPSPRLPQYRVTLFYGPEEVENRPSTLSCIFNVKKRSWKGGVQVVIEVDHAQVDQAREALDFPAWLRDVLEKVPEDDRADYESRGQDILIQQLCAVKLELLLEQGLTQENQRIPTESRYDELNQAVVARDEQLKAAIATELDVEDDGSG